MSEYDAGELVEVEYDARRGSDVGGSWSPPRPFAGAVPNSLTATSTMSSATRATTATTSNQGASARLNIRKWVDIRYENLI